jgi:hypothetical protein
MNAFGIVYPQYSLQAIAKVMIFLHIVTLKQTYCVKRQIRSDILVMELIDEHMLDIQNSSFKLTIKTNAKTTIDAHLIKIPNQVVDEVVIQ